MTMPETITTVAADMSEHWRLVTAEGSTTTHRVYGTWWVSADHVKSIDVTIWHKEGRYGRVFYSADLTAFIRDGQIDLPKHMIASDKLADAEDAWGLLLDVINAAASAFHSDRPPATVETATVKPSLEAVALALRNASRDRAGLSPTDRLPWSISADADRADARAVLALLPGRTEAEVRRDLLLELIDDVENGEVWHWDADRLAQSLRDRIDWEG